MKKYLLLIVHLILVNYCIGQSNTFPASGNVGIGTLSADQKLTVKGGGIGFDHNSTDKKLYSPVDGTLEWVTHNGATEHGFAISHQGNRSIYLNTNGGSYFNGGKLGIGVSNPLNGLHVFGLNDFNAGSIRLGNSGANDAIISYGWDGVSQDLFKISKFPHNGLTDGFDLLTINNSGNVGIGTADAKGYKLAVAGNMIAESVKVKLQGAWPDFVFSNAYELPTLQETEKQIRDKGHLPGIPTAAEVKANGIDLGEMNAKLLQKIEELTLYILEQDKRIAKLESKQK